MRVEPANALRCKRANSFVAVTIFYRQPFNSQVLFCTDRRQCCCRCAIITRLSFISLNCDHAAINHAWICVFKMMLFCISRMFLMNTRKDFLFRSFVSFLPNQSIKIHLLQKHFTGVPFWLSFSVSFSCCTGEQSLPSTVRCTTGQSIQLTLI